jgi:hypothetical protein
MSATPSTTALWLIITVIHMSDVICELRLEPGDLFAVVRRHQVLHREHRVHGRLGRLGCLVVHLVHLCCGSDVWQQPKPSCFLQLRPFFI